MGGKGSHYAILSGSELLQSWNVENGLGYPSVRLHKSQFRLGILNLPFSFNASARRLIEDSNDISSNKKTELSIGDYLTQEGYSNEFVDDYLIVSWKLDDVHHETNQLNSE
jgi:predicted NAD/FAD-binding protein